MNDLELLDDLLAHLSTWVEPVPDLEDLVVWAVAEAAPAPSRPSAITRSWRRTASVLTVAAAIAIAVVVGAVALRDNSSSAEYAGRLQATGLAPGARASAHITLYRRRVPGRARRGVACSHWTAASSTKRG